MLACPVVVLDCGCELVVPMDAVTDGDGVTLEVDASRGHYDKLCTRHAEEGVD